MKPKAPKPAGPVIPKKIELWKLDRLIPYARNARTHTPEQVAEIAGSILEFGWTNPVLADEVGDIIAGHGRVLAARQLAMASVPVIVLSHLTDAQKRALRLADNRIPLNAGWNDELLALELREIRDEGGDVTKLGFPDDELARLLGEAKQDAPGPGLLAEFGANPFSVFDARRGEWQDRKRAWMAIGLDSIQGRDDDLQNMGSRANPRTDLAGLKMSEVGTGTSVFDPVLAELLVRWFSPRGGLVLDPFAGGSVRGVVSVRCGRSYLGVDLRPEQVEANRKQWAEIQAKAGQPVPAKRGKRAQEEPGAPAWRIGDSLDIDTICKGARADFILSCPPYHDLEVYSADPSDLSNMDYPSFLAAYRAIIAKACDLLLPDRFAAWVVGDVREKRSGAYRNFVADTIQAFIDAGLDLWNEALLVQVVGSVGLRCGKAFRQSRKLGKLHQNVLVFVKGSGKRAAEACGVPEAVADPEPSEGDEQH